jgi:hypothetical protein
MIALVDIAFFMLVLAGAFFVGVVGALLLKELTKKETTDESQKPQ